MRTSSYVIYVNLPDRPDQQLLVHGYTGAFDLVSGPVAAYVRAQEIRPAAKPLYGSWRSTHPGNGAPARPPSDEAITTLRRRGYLTDLSHSDEERLVRTIASTLHNRPDQKRPKYIVMPTYNCNLRCAYCFQDHMRTDPNYRHLLRSMSPQLIDRMFLALPHLEALQGVAADQAFPRTIGFFGGEPLLASNRPAVTRIIAKARDLGPTSFWGVTNGTELDAYKDVLHPDCISRLQITLDGPPTEHDTRRVYADGSGSFSQIADNITMVLDHGVSVNIRLNLDRANILHVPALAEQIERRGWWTYDRFSVYTAPVRPENDNVDKRTTFNSGELSRALDELRVSHPVVARVLRPTDEIKSRARRIFDATRPGPPAMLESYCSAHTGMFVFDAFGDIYACWERTGDPKVRIGTINPDGTVTLNRPVHDMWRSRTVASNPVCNACRYAFHCGGGCAVLAAAKTGRYHMNYCDAYSFRFRAAIAEAYAEYKAGTLPSAAPEALCDQ